ncbi:MAG TPA: hypothetical protein PKO36_02915 [Candidatus Hydrogenedentes bacterium]|nr:hypothetical protein [Candidatus Hydrogenedentota bacterium]HRT21757.1 hypothetical protein [Candidatus Hydrogenedentota bacterium]HRT65338.1 hypothetical protein [Candidatus Hydrogenedentota bacterium]
MRPYLSRGNAGMTLLECLAYMAIFAVIVNVSMSTFVSATQLSTMGTRGLDRLNMADEFRDGIARLIREAGSVAEGVGAYRTGPDTLVLAMPAQSGTRRYTVLGLVGPQNRFSRMDVSETDGVYEVTHFSHYALPVAAVRFGFDNADPLKARLIAVDASLVNTHRGKPPVPYRFSAALRSRSAGGKP